MKINEAVALYIELRDKKAVLKKEADEKIKPVQEKMDLIEAKILQAFEKLGTDSIKTDAGTAYTTSKTSATVADREAFFNFVRDNEEWGLLDIRAAKTNIDQYRETHNDIPPGINWREEVAVNFRRS